MGLATIAVVMTLAAEAYKQGLDAAESQAETSSSNITNTLSNIGAGIAAAGIALVTGALVEMGHLVEDSITSAMGMQDAQVQLDSVLRNTGATSGVTAGMVEGLGKQYDKLTEFSNETIVAAGGVMARFANISADTFPTAMTTAMDLAQSLGLDLPNAARMAGGARCLPNAVVSLSPTISNTGILTCSNS